MKTLKESLQDELLCGKHLFEKLKIRKSKKINIPTTDIENSTISTENVWKSFEMPEGKYVIYTDMYKGNYPHIATVDDMVAQMMFWQDDFEDFNFNDDILYSSDDEKDIIKWYCKNHLKCELPDANKYETVDDWENSFDKNTNNTGSIDSNEFLYNVYNGKCEIDGLEFDDIFDIESIADYMSDFI